MEVGTLNGGTSQGGTPTAGFVRRASAAVLAPRSRVTNPAVGVPQLKSRR